MMTTEQTIPRAAFTAAEVAQMYGVSEAQVRAMVRAGTLAKVPHLGRSVRISITELERAFGPVPRGSAA